MSTDCSLMRWAYGLVLVALALTTVYAGLQAHQLAEQARRTLVVLEQRLAEAKEPGQSFSKAGGGLSYVVPSGRYMILDQEILCSTDPNSTTIFCICHTHN
jgi:hypothetical protein